MDELKDIVNNKKVGKGYWGGDIQDEINFKKETGISLRCIIEKNNDQNKKCIFTNKVAKYLVYFARAY
jgi:prolyl-tRNA synthetase